MSIEQVDADFCSYVLREFGEIVVFVEGKIDSPTIQKYYRIWCHQQTKIEIARQLLPDERKFLYDFEKAHSDSYDQLCAAIIPVLDSIVSKPDPILIYQ